MIDLPKFDPSIHFHLGIADTKIKHWALYEPACQRFLFASNDQDTSHLQVIRMLCSSRYNLFLCDISTAKNYHATILDNTCCENWTLIADFNESELFVAPIHNVTALVPSGTTEVDKLLIQKQKNWIQFVYYWVNWLRYGPLAKSWPQIDLFIEQMFDLKFDDTSTRNFFSNLQKLTQDIKMELYLGTDIDLTQNKIIKLLENSVWYPKIGS